MGGMLVLEWAYFGKTFIRCIVPIATSSRQGAWGISWGEVQRQSIFADPKYKDGFYKFSDPPSTGLGAARMSALLMYRSHSSLERRFGRKTLEMSRKVTLSEKLSASLDEAHFQTHNDGHNTKSSHQKASPSNVQSELQENSTSDSTDPRFEDTCNSPSNLSQLVEVKNSGPTDFSVQSYLRYQGSKFVKRFDANCYISLTRKMDTHDVSRKRSHSITDALSLIEQPALVIGIESDGLFPISEQIELVSGIPNARLERIGSMEGHDAFLLQLDQVNQLILNFLLDVIPEFYESSTNLVTKGPETEFIYEEDVTKVSEVVCM